jgi:hypothetical protein
VGDAATGDSREADGVGPDEGPDTGADGEPDGDATVEADGDEGDRGVEEADRGEGDGGEDDADDVPGDADAEADGRSCTSPGDCVDGNPCTLDLCLSDSCTYAWDDDGTPCPDGLFCNGPDLCQSGVCVPQGAACADEPSCDEDNDWCRCDDGNGCTTGDHLVEGGVCAGTNTNDLLCDVYNSSVCRRCCGGSCQNMTENGRCGHCGYSCTSPPEWCAYSPTSACGWPWCCASP